MSALSLRIPHPVTASTPTPAAAPATIDVAEAARRMAVSERRVRQRCASTWAPAGLARQDEGGAWLIREDAAPELARVKMPDALPFDWSQLTARQRRELQERQRIVNAWAAARDVGFRRGLTEDAISAGFVEHLEATEGVRLSRGTLHRWWSAFRADGVAGLVDGRWAQKAREEADPFLAEVKRLYLLPGKRLKVTACHLMASLAAEREGWRVASMSATRRYIARIPRGVVVKRRDGAEAFVNHAEPFIIRDYSGLASNEVWCGDHHPLDVFVVGPGGKLCRPWLTAWEDMRSRLITGWAIFAHDPNSDTIIESFRRGVLAHGVPERVLIDNGRDYRAKSLTGRTRRVHVEHDVNRITGLFGQLGVMTTHAQPYHPQSKPIERFFRTMEERFVATFDTYAGNCPANKPEQLEAMKRAGRAPKLEDLIACFESWLEADYHGRPHFGDAMEGRTPAAVFAEHLATKRTAPEAVLNVLCLRPVGPLKVSRNGVRVDGLFYFDTKLAELLGRSVLLRVDDRDRSRVQVYSHPEDRFICLARQVAKLPFVASSQDVRAAMASKRAARRKTREYFGDVRPRMADDLPATMIRAAAAKLRPAPEAKPAVRPVRTSLEEDVKAVQRALAQDALRLAAGAESVSLTDVGHVFDSHGRLDHDAEDHRDPLLDIAAALRGSP